MRLHVDTFHILGTELHVLRTAHAGVDRELVRDKVLELEPEAVLLELCEGRLLTLLAELHGSDEGGRGPQRLSGRIISLAERVVSRVVGGELGEDMLGAIEAAEELEAELVPVDMDLDGILRRIRIKAPLTERLKFQVLTLLDALCSVFRPSKTREMLTDSVTDERAVREMIEWMRRKFPNVTRVLIDERNTVIAENTIEYLHRSDVSRAVLVIGAAHYGVLDILREAERELDDEDTASGKDEEETAD